MELIKKIEERFGFIDVFTNANQSILYVIPHGYVSSSLAKKDIEFAIEFEKKHYKDWTYIVNTSKAIIVSPLNPFVLQGLKKLKRMKEYIVYAPSPIVRMMLYLSSWLNRPDRIIKTEKALQIELNKGI